MSAFNAIQERWPQLSRLLDEALELAAPARLEWLAALPAEHAPLRETLRRLLEQQARLENDDFLCTLPQAVNAPQAAGESPQTGDTVGPWRLVRELGRGGMGTVWLAERSDGQLKRQVALKLPQLTWGQGLSARLERERDILATLVHPNIARLYDAGVDALGRPWLAIEHVQGLSIDLYCRENAPDVKARLALLLQVAQAVAYAHSRLVIHRDLKPSNIIVGDDGQVRLLDFGIAKLMEGDQTQETALTRAAGHALTLAYASPEQVRGQPLGTASDVYSLAVVAYELLTGAQPYRLQRGSAAELEEQIASRGQAPLASSVVDDRLARQQLRGDLDAILNKALKKEPGERYVSVDAMASDIRRHLDGEAVAARPDAMLYRAGRVLHRHRRVLTAGVLTALAFGIGLGAGATALVILALGAGLLAALWQARLARQKEKEAQRQATRARAVQDFILDIFRSNAERQDDPHLARQVTARELLDRGAARLETALQDAPEARIEVLSTLREMYNQMQLDEQAVAIDRRRIALLRQLFGNRDRRVAEALIELAGVLHSTPGRDDILPALQEAQTILDAAREPDTPLRAELDTALARRFQNLSVPKMKLHADEAVRVLRAQPRPDLFALGIALHLAARARAMMGEAAASEAVYVQALEVQSRQVPLSHVALCQTRCSLGLTLLEQHRVADAEAVFQQAADETRRALGEDDINTLFASSRQAAAMHLRGGRRQAMDLHRRTLARVLDLRGADDTLYAPAARTDLANSLLGEGALEEALALIQSVSASNRKHYAGSTVLAGTLRQESLLLTALGDLPGAAASASEAMANWRQGTAGGVGAWRANRLHLAQARLALASGEVAAVLESLQRVVVPDGPRLALPADEFERGILRSTAWLLDGDASQALATMEDVVKAMAGSPAPGEMPALFADAQVQWARALCAAGQPQAALAPARAAAAWRQAEDDAHSPWTANAEVVLAECLLSVSAKDDAVRLAQQAHRRLAAHGRLGEHLRRPLSELQTRLDSCL